MILATFLSIFYAVALSDYQCPNNETSCNIVCGNNNLSNSNIQCENSLITASNVTTALTILCPSLSSCRNMTTICPVGDDTKCKVSCTDSLSCDRTTIHSESTETKFRCISSDIDKTNICSNDITINLSGNTNKAILLCALNTTNTNATTVTVCNGITVTTTTPSSSANSSLSFLCYGNGIECNSINITAPNTATLNVVATGASSNINDSVFINNNNMNIELNDDSLLSMSSFIGSSMVDGSSVSIIMANGSVSRSNTFIFNDLSSFKMINTVLTDFALFTKNNITINNDMGRTQSVLVEGIIADGTNMLTAQKASTFALKCSNNYTKCGSLGIIDVVDTLDIMILIDSGITFGSTINAEGVQGVNITALEGAIFDGLSLNAARAEQITFNVYGETRGNNLINGLTVMGFDIYCNNPQSCSGDLGLIISPLRTRIHCIGTGCDMLTLIVPNSGDEVTVLMQYCPCEDERRNLCITEWNIVCSGDKTSTIVDRQCTGPCCFGIIDQLQETYNNKYECPTRATKTTYICEEEDECSIDCRNTTQYGESSLFECSSKGVIDASMATSLSVFCSTEDATCSHLNIFCPNNISLCHIHCDGDCKGINIIGNASRVIFECINSSCSSIQMDNTDGDISIYMTGINSNVSNSAISAKSVMLGGDSYLFCNNNITYDVALKVDGDSKAWFELNRIIDNQEGDIFILSINTNGVYHSETSNMSFTIIDNALVFTASDYIELLIEKGNSFSHRTVQVVDECAHLYIFNWGLLKHNMFGSGDMDKVIFSCNGACLDNKIRMNNVTEFHLVVLTEGQIHDRNTDISIAHIDILNVMANEGGNISNIKFADVNPSIVSVTNSHGFINNISLNATNALNFSLTCFGGCNETLISNEYILSNVDHVVFSVTNDAIDALNTVIINATNISMFELVANAHGSINDIVINHTVKNMIVSCGAQGSINNVSVLPQTMDVLSVQNDNGIINGLNIKPRDSIHKVIVNIKGTLSNSSIDATKCNNLSVICSSTSTSVDGSCTNLTLRVPVSDDAVSSLLCKNEGCQNITFYTVNDMDDLDFSLTECPCKKAVKTSCIERGNEWSIYCESNEDGQASVFANNKCTGVCCGDVVKDLRMGECDYGGGGKKKHSHGAVVAVVCALILVSVLIASAFYYFKKKKRAEEEALLVVND